MSNNHSMSMNEEIIAKVRPILEKAQEEHEKSKRNFRPAFILAEMMSVFASKEPGTLDDFDFKTAVELYGGKKFYDALPTMRRLYAMAIEHGWTEESPLDLHCDRNLFFIPHTDREIFVITTQSLQYLFIIEEYKVHIRRFWKRPRKNKQKRERKPTLQDFKDADFTLKYGDFRDAGYVATLELILVKLNDWPPEARGWQYSWGFAARAYSEIYSTMTEIEISKDDQ